mmetsp:Transcript_14664/g.33994  ORF Transcript_14664/g.33994 Transcript_14664/m.33994 type:complete len:183 (+) Transcript_14664:571-1119(+)
MSKFSDLIKPNAPTTSLASMPWSKTPGPSIASISLCVVLMNSIAAASSSAVLSWIATSGTVGPGSIDPSQAHRTRARTPGATSGAASRGSGVGGGEAVREASQAVRERRGGGLPPGPGRPQVSGPHLDRPPVREEVDDPALLGLREVDEDAPVAVQACGSHEAVQLHALPGIVLCALRLHVH